MVSTAPYGAWRSPIGAALTAAHTGGPEDVGVVGDEVWWTAPRPEESGRRTLIRSRAGAGEQVVLPPPWNVRSRVMEYGGAPWVATARAAGGPLLVFSNFDDQRLYAYEPDAPGTPDAEAAEPRPLTPLSAVGGGLRWVDLVLLADRAEVWGVLEEFTGPAPTDVRRVLAAVPLDGSAANDRTVIRELTNDVHRFLTGPRLSPDGRHAVWIAWDHPRMPWDGTELKIADVSEDGALKGVRTLLGGPAESIAQAEWAADGTLIAASDRTGWWNLHRVDPRSGVAVNLCPRDEEFAGPLWKVGFRWFAPLASGLIAVLHGRGAMSLGILDPRAEDATAGEGAGRADSVHPGVTEDDATARPAGHGSGAGAQQPVDAVGPWTEWQPTLAVDGTRVIGVAASPSSGYEVVELDTCTGHARVIGEAHTDLVDPAYYPEPVSRTFSGPGGRDIHTHLYPPRNPNHQAPDGELPPYVVWAHGGPTSRAPQVLSLEVAYFTSRGIGVVVVNYGGSTGYGRAYRERLREQWGVVDVEDCAAAAQALAADGSADLDRLAIRGGSAGGWTTAASLTSTSLYACGTISFPVLDLVSWATDDTHDFEAQYLESLIGPLAEVPERYRERSPLQQADQLRAPFLLLQGLDDAICPPVQCERFLTAIEGRGIPHAYLAFAGEGHGFRRAESIVQALEAELSLYGQVFGFSPEGIVPVELAP
ncbi:prolyl oligopeptidase family serine peptidase [Streptomyces zagrosensis]|uniref:Acetyl esterase/lipase n=1 Tax=Streptomyces zagrosensis TaxID=1042984 RepID=A0A7W9V0L9_9ACTN|nr:prolyl oligopeptidase family serine peptidase [Streptomyces zagrosensis]MBB5937411.1 acetyl esterase/lipase [Streptomyces zagrosensis]